MVPQTVENVPYALWFFFIFCPTFMRETLIVIGLVLLAVGLRSAHTGYIRKLGALVFLLASFCLLYFLTGSLFWGSMGVLLWFFLPWIELLTRIRRMRLPVNNRLSQKPIPNSKHFPNAPEATVAMEEAGFEHVSDCGWEWDGMHQFFRIFWHPEERAVAAVCLCEQSDVAFSFITITSHDGSGRSWRTTNFPFAPTLRHPPEMLWNHVPCRCNCFHQILRDHREYLVRTRISVEELRVPDPESIEEIIEEEMKKQLAHNLAAGIIRLTGDGHFQYSMRGLFFLWGQFVKDMVRFC